MKIYMFFVMVFLCFFIYLIYPEQKETISQSYGQCYIVDPDNNSIISFKFNARKETVEFIISIVVLFVSVLVDEFVDKAYLHKENQTSHFGMKHRMQNPRCKLYPVLYRK